MIDALYRLVYRLGYPAARLVWRFTRPAVRGALVAVWHEGQILLVRHSYRHEWSFPGGGIDAGESEIEAAVRELREELGWKVTPAALAPAGSVEFLWHNRHDNVTFFRLSAAELQPIAIDRRELIEARFWQPAEALKLPLLPHIRHLLEGRLATTSEHPRKQAL